MATKKTSSTKRSTESVGKIRKFNNLLMNEKGEELPSRRSLSTTIRLPSLGERVQRYMRSPELLQNHHDNPDNWDPDDVDTFFEDMPDGSRKPVSPYSDTYKKAQDRNKKRLAEEAETAKKKAAEEERQRKEDFRKKLLEAKADIAADQEQTAEPDETAG